MKLSGESWAVIGLATLGVAIVLVVRDNMNDGFKVTM